MKALRIPKKVSRKELRAAFKVIENEMLRQMCVRTKLNSNVVNFLNYELAKIVDVNNRMNIFIDVWLSHQIETLK